MRDQGLGILRTVLLAAVVAVTSAGVANVPEQAPTLRVHTELVELDVTVLGQDGRPVSGLTAADFTVLEDGVPQPLVACVPIELPTWTGREPAWVRDIGADVATNRSDARRAVVVIMDDFQIRRDPGVTRTAKVIASRVIDELGPADLAAVVYTFDRRKGQEFTVDRPHLRAAIERFEPSELPLQPPKRFDASALPPGAPSALRLPSGACLDMSCLLAALRNTARILGEWRSARKTVVLITHGEPLRDVADLDTLPGELRETLAALQQANVTVYEFDPRGLETERQETTLGLFADNVTGGRVIRDTNAPGELVPQMFRESSSYYLLGYQPTNLRQDGRFRRIRVQVHRPGVRILARAGYYAPTDHPSKLRALSATDRALSGGLPTGDLPMALTVAPFGMREGSAAALAVVAGIDGTSLAPGAQVHLIATAFDDTWKQVAQVTEQFVMPGERDEPSSLDLGTGLTLRPGRYEVRVALTSPATGLTGSVYTSITVPDFARAPLSMSGLLIERAPGGSVMPDALAALLPARPTTARIFSPADAVSVVARVRQGGRRPLVPIDLAVRIVDDQDRVAFETTTTLDASSFDERRETDHRVALPLNRLADGPYLLTIEAVSGQTRVRRDVRFTVRRD